MKVLFTAAECAPFFKTGGLGDVASALPKSLKSLGVDVRVVLPFYDSTPQIYKDQMEDITHFYVQVGWRNQYCGIKKLELDNITYYFIDNQYYFFRGGIYGYFDDGERYAFFCQAVIEMMEKIDFIPNIVHVNDFHTAMIPVLLAEKYNWITAYRSIETVLTIHNLQFQGIYDPKILEEVFNLKMDLYYNGSLRYDDGVSFLKGGILYAGKVTTVSPSYAQEIQTPEFGEGLDSLLRQVNYKLSGILNGIDTEINDPATDPNIPYHFSLKKMTGKQKNKAALQKRLGLPVAMGIPLIAMVSRLTPQKGCHLILHELHQILERNLQIVILGTGYQDIENSFRYFAGRYPEKISANISFDVKLAQLMYAASDGFLMPSAFEPCGLSQMISMRYGSLPIVHEIGGLKDSVKPYNPIEESGTGFGFVDYEPHILTATIDKANALYWDKPKIWGKLVKEAMQEDFSWKNSSLSYIQLYEALIRY